MPSTPRGKFTVEHAILNCVPVSQVNQGAAEDDDGAKTEAVGTRATAEELSNFLVTSVAVDKQILATKFVIGEKR